MSSPAGPFTVHFSAAVAEQIRRVLQRAGQAGRNEQALAAYYSALVGMETNPEDFGEPLYRLPALRL